MPESSANSFYLNEKNHYQVHMQVEAFFLLAYDPTVAKAREKMDQRNAVAKNSTTIQGVVPGDRSYHEKDLKT